YAIGRLGLRGGLPKVRSMLDSPDPEVLLAAVWVAGRLGDAPSASRVAAILHQLAPDQRGTVVLAQGDGAGQLKSDAAEMVFDTTVQAASRLLARDAVPELRAALDNARARIRETELDRPARLPMTEMEGSEPPTRRSLFESRSPA